MTFRKADFEVPATYSVTPDKNDIKFITSKLKEKPMTRSDAIELIASAAPEILPSKQRFSDQRAIHPVSPSVLGEIPGQEHYPSTKDLYNMNSKKSTSVSDVYGDVRSTLNSPSSTGPISSAFKFSARRSPRSGSGISTSQSISPKGHSSVSSPKMTLQQSVASSPKASHPSPKSHTNSPKSLYIQTTAPLSPSIMSPITFSTASPRPSQKSIPLSPKAQNSPAVQNFKARSPTSNQRSTVSPSADILENNKASILRASLLYDKPMITHLSPTYGQDGMMRSEVDDVDVEASPIPSSHGLNIYESGFANKPWYLLDSKDMENGLGDVLSKPKNHSVAHVQRTCMHFIDEIDRINQEINEKRLIIDKYQEKIKMMVTLDFSYEEELEVRVIIRFLRGDLSPASLSLNFVLMICY